MPVLREVITRFKFETDEEGAKKVDRRLTGMKRGIGGLGKLLGVSLGIAGGKALFSFGQSATRAEFILKNLAGTEFAPLRQRMQQIREDLNRVRAGAGNIFRERDFDIAAAGYIRTFGTARKELELFDQIFRSAAQQSAVTGENVVTLVQRLTSAIQSGNFEALLDFPGIDQAFVKRLQDINAILDPGEIGGQAAIRRNAAELSRALRSVAADQRRSLADIPTELLKADSASARLLNGLENIAQSINRKLVPAISSLVEQLEKFTGFGEIFAGDPTKTVTQNIGTAVKRFGTESRNRRIVEQLRGGIIDPRKAVTRPDLLLQAQRLGPLPGGERSVIFNNTFNINGAMDPQAVAAEIERVQAKTYNDARQNVPPTEDR